MGEPVPPPDALLGKVLFSLLGDICLPPPLFDRDERCLVAAVEGAVVSLTGGARAVAFLRPKAFLAAPLQLQVRITPPRATHTQA